MCPIGFVVAFSTKRIKQTREKEKSGNSLAIDKNNNNYTYTTKLQINNISKAKRVKWMTSDK